MCGEGSGSQIIPQWLLGLWQFIQRAPAARRGSHCGDTLSALIACALAGVCVASSL